MLNVMRIEGRLEDGYLFCMLLLGRWVVSRLSSFRQSRPFHLSSPLLHCPSLSSPSYFISYLRFSISVFCILPNFQREMWPVLLAAVVLALSSAPVSAQDDKCGLNEIRSGSECVCQSGYFKAGDDHQKERCNNECDELYWSYFTYGKCNKDIYSRIAAGQRPACNARCAWRLRWWTIIGLLIIFASAVLSLIFTLPICIATCSSCLHAKKANKHAKRVVMESQVNNTSKDQQVASMGYNPYAYWPYYGRS
ncbi:hypothetical protein WR25_11890 [Diploscapter pachys]|uniref:Uncharacterized protein n=1 Tax=Diploscapter pachys TaxID=2018661 RepID=A0A2A2JB07_9BILA|nr:hypothetical protein WR25_11890 [Diploscapter pachys]